MSLINDALKRAKQAHDQQAAPPVHSAPLHTVPPRAPSLVWPLTILVVALATIIIGVAIFWQKTKINPAPASAVAQSQPVPQPAAVAPTPTPVTIAETAPVPPQAEPTPPPPAPVVAAPAAPPIERAVTPPAPTPAPVNEPPAAPTFPAVRLQGILYQPGRPAAIINGRTLFIGDHIGDATVIAINQSSATLVWNGVTNVLSLP